jgi:hypothetical protein
MAKFIERRKVIELRKSGKSYSEIRKIVNVSKSSLSLWLKDVILTDEQVYGLKMKKVRAVERYKKSMSIRSEKRRNKCYKKQKRKWLPLSNREEFLAGLFLYWGEGNKASTSSINVSNTDPQVIKFGYYWMKSCLKIPEDKIFIMLHLYTDMDIEKETNYWSREIGMKRSQFKRPYIKNSLRSDIDQKGFGHGTCGLWAFKTEIKQEILMAIRAISDNYAQEPTI